MRKITAIKAQRKNPQRVSIFLDGEFAFGLSRIVAAWLKVGQELDEAKIASLLEEDLREKAYQQALLYLSYRPRSLAEIRQNLRKHEYPESVIEETLARLQRNRFADDEAFTRAWIENRNAFRPRSARALRMELRRKGIADETIQTALEALADDEKAAYDAGLKKARKLASKVWQSFRKKLGDFLARRGFSYSIIAPLLPKLWEETHDGGDYSEERG